MARKFNGSDEYLQIGNVPVSAAPITVSCLFNSDDITHNGCMVHLTDRNETDEYFMLTIRGADPGDFVQWTARTTGTNVSATSTLAFTNVGWHHACGIEYAADSRAVFYDGGNKGTETTNVVPAGLDRTALGSMQDSSPGLYYNGELAEVAIWNVALTDAEVYILSLGTSPLLVRPESLVAYWPLMGRTSPEIDLIGRFELTVTGATIIEHPPVLYAHHVQIGLVAAAVPGTTTIQLDWTDNSDNEDGFSIERKTDAGVFAEIDTVGAGIETYDNINVPVGHTYTYRVKATSSALGDSEYSNEAAEVV